MKKRILAILLSLTCICSMAMFTGCSSEEPEEPTEQAEATEVQEEEEEPKLVEFTDEELAEVALTNTYTTRYGEVLQVTFPSFSFDYTDNWQVTQEEVEMGERVTLTSADGIEIRFRHGIQEKEYDFTADSEATSAVEVTKVANCDITATNELRAEALEEIIMDSDISSVRQFDKLFSESLGVDVSITSAAARHIADAACKEQTGARALSEKLFAAYKDGLFAIAGKDSVNNILLDAEDGELEIKYIEGKRNGKGSGKERDLYEKVPLDLPERSVRGAVHRAETIIGDVGDMCKAYTYNQLRAVSYLYTHIIEVLLRKGRKNPMLDDVTDVLFDLMEDSITENLRGRSVSLDRAIRYERDIRTTLWAGRDILQKYCRHYLAKQEEPENVEPDKAEI